MQSIYAMHQNGTDDIVKQEKFLLYSLESIQELYLTILSAIVEIQKNESILIDKRAQKHLATAEEKNPNRKFVNNLIFKFLLESNSLNNFFEDDKINVWQLNNDTILTLLASIKESVFYRKYMQTADNNFIEDQRFIEAIFTEIIVPNEKLYEYLEDNKLTWIDDIPVINTLIAKQLGEINLKNDRSFAVPKIYKDADDKEFACQLFRKTVLNENDFVQYYDGKTPNWDLTRIASLDTIIIKMAICEMLKFPSIPAKVTINEYVEIAKEYSTPNSSIFINGVLDVISKEFQSKNLLNKIGRGML
jgi:transcription antitermination protein NusB